MEPTAKSEEPRAESGERHAASCGPTGERHAASCGPTGERHGEKRILFVRSGGGLPGIDIHAGIWLALEEAGIVATECVGTSAGALVSAYDASAWTGREFTRLLRHMRDDDVRDEVPFWKFRIPFITHFMRTRKLSTLLGMHVATTFKYTRKKLHVCVLDEGHRRARFVSEGRLAPALLAATAIRGVFDHVRLGCSFCSDAGVVAHLPVPAHWTSFDEVYLLVATGRCDDAYSGPDTMLTRLLSNVRIQSINQLHRTLQDTGSTPTTRVHLIWPQVDTSTGVLRFDHGLIDRAYVATRRFVGSEELGAKGEERRAKSEQGMSNVQ